MSYSPFPILAGSDETSVTYDVDDTDGPVNWWHASVTGTTSTSVAVDVTGWADVHAVVFAFDAAGNMSSATEPDCGNDQIDVGEDCDGSALGGESCVSLGYGSGTLACSAGCAFDLSGCSPAASERHVHGATITGGRVR